MTYRLSGLIVYSAASGAFGGREPELGHRRVRMRLFQSQQFLIFFPQVKQLAFETGLRCADDGMLLTEWACRIGRLLVQNRDRMRGRTGDLPDSSFLLFVSFPPLGPSGVSSIKVSGNKLLDANDEWRRCVATGRGEAWGMPVEAEGRGAC